ncbi:glycosyltransferase family 2 protein [Natranaerobius thermophilus]|uniref:Glycosyl transferase family 2 n=1 Tax=Natranaerobius thermophilus (strain ATCC BAA-1301 / DSM 18059 / JW/NM-WN-LF) TaxID=457570 RepID=B2A4H6_NATTJ|nr:glycosyltransferase family 2 protein [Natranaerobius thermophilus]ACB85153.1 glycosyl transferase family 2 [Natranaerobius thermophilus JW/NM-WN-LF]
MTVAVSIVMAVYNEEKFLQQAIDSALSQTYPSTDLIVVNDGSTDSTKTILDNLNDQRVTVIHLEENQGAANALNIGIEQASGNWISIHDADDISYPTKIEEQVKYIKQNPQLVGVGTLVEYIAGSPNVTQKLLKRLVKINKSVISAEQINKSKYYICYLTHSSMMFSKELFWVVGGYNPEFNILYDYDLWLRLLEEGNIAKVPKVLLKYRVHQDSLSRKNRYKTVNEIQIASSKAICRLLIHNKQTIQPKVVVIGPQKACENYECNIAPTSGLQVISTITKNSKKEISKIIKKYHKGQIDGIIMLGRSPKQKYHHILKTAGLTSNRDYFTVFNILK